MNDSCSTATWEVEQNPEEPIRHVRLQQSGKNASGQTHYLSLSGFEIYGTVVGVCDDLGKNLELILIQYLIFINLKFYDFFF